MKRDRLFAAIFGWSGISATVDDGCCARATYGISVALRSEPNLGVLRLRNLFPSEPIGQLGFTSISSKGRIQILRARSWESFGGRLVQESAGFGTITDYIKGLEFA